MQIIVRCRTPEGYDAVTHAVIGFDTILVDNLLIKIALANEIKASINTSEKSLEGFMGLEFTSSRRPILIRACSPEDVGLTEEEFDGLSDDGYYILPAKMDGHSWKEVAIHPCMQMIIAGDVDTNFSPPHIHDGRVYWYGYARGGRAETYSLYEKDLRDIREALV